MFRTSPPTIDFGDFFAPNPPPWGPTPYFSIVSLSYCTAQKTQHGTKQKPAFVRLVSGVWVHVLVRQSRGNLGAGMVLALVSRQSVNQYEATNIQST
jgi:hypothetical protein